MKPITFFEYMAEEAGRRAVLTGATRPISIRGARPDALLRHFGAKPAPGRTFRKDDDQLRKHRVALLSHVLLEGRFGADPSNVGCDILLNGEA